MSIVFDRLEEARVIPVLTVEDADEAEHACIALMAGGLSTVEITFRTKGAADAIRRVSGIDGLLVGAGTILSVEQLEAAALAGARFAVGPGTSTAVIEAAARTDVPFVPGVATPTEIERVRSVGLSVVKLFPASLVGGPAFVRAVAPVYPDVRFVPTGGVNPETLGSYLELPAVLACAGTWICDRALLGEHRFDEVERRARAARELADSV
jgi:2-dehydro-3-deoxyphosphogluconate aldolase / (4S)-4-hydroxy-2-oxoglutarate aldolase